MTHYQTSLREQIGKTITRLYFKGADDRQVLRYCRVMQHRYLGASLLIAIEASLADGEPRRNAKEHSIIAAVEWRRQARKAQESMQRSAAQQRFHDILKPMAQYVINSGFEVHYTRTGGETVVLIEGEEECFHLEFDDRDAFIRQVNAYEDELGRHDGDDVIAKLAAAKPYVESLA